MEYMRQCPFCGGDPVLIENEPTKGFYFVECAECASRGSISDREHAILHWNNRSTFANSIPMLECAECNGGFYAFADGSIPNYCPICGCVILHSNSEG